MNSQNNDVKKLASLIKDLRIAMLTTTEEDGSLRSRPMATQKTDFDGTLWFFTHEHSPKVAEVKREQRVNVSYADAGSNTYVSVSGKAMLVTDRAKIKELWSPVLKAWFPSGEDDPELALLKIDVEKAEYWDMPGSTVVKLVGFVKAIATGKAYDPGEHEKINLAR
jgi:general stress protein 26